MVILLSYKGLEVQQDPIFNRDFPIWRGIAFVILYIWILGYNINFYEKFKISYHIILDF